MKKKMYICYWVRGSAVFFRSDFHNISGSDILSGTFNINHWKMMKKNLYSDFELEFDDITENNRNLAQRLNVDFVS